MTLNEYAKQVGFSLCKAYNTRDRVTINDLIQVADDTLVRSNIEPQLRLTFWAEVRSQFFVAGPVLERQANSSLHALMQLIETALANRTNG